MKGFKEIQEGIAGSRRIEDNWKNTWKQGKPWFLEMVVIRSGEEGTITEIKWPRTLQDFE